MNKCRIKRVPLCNHECEQCGFNPEIEEQRKAEIRNGGLTDIAKFVGDKPMILKSLIVKRAVK